MKEYIAIKRSEVKKDISIRGTKYCHVTLTHGPTGINVTKFNCVSHKRDVEPLYDELDKEVVDYLLTKLENSKLYE